ncbi:MAG TPA: tetratricopeptide repeat protein, partial [Syntrophomonadaceae bacterium]|nr:tetratricopeptide repeat protein [Syntrophomonadaceae bacterium]
RTNLELFNRPSNQFWIKRYRQAVTEVEKKNYKIAEDQLRNLLLEQDGPVSLYQLLGLCCLAGENRDEAIKMWQKGLTMDCSNPVLLEYIDSLPVSGKIESIAHYTPTVTGNSNARFHWTWAAGILLIVLAVPAIIFFNRETESNPAPRPALTARNLQNDGALKTDSQQDVAVQNLTPAGSDYDVEREEQYYYAGRKAYLARDWKSAADNYSVVVGMGTGSYLNREALYYLARTNYLRGQLDLAQQYYLKYIKQFSGTAYCDDSLFFLGCIYVEQNDRERAVGVFRQLKNIAPDSGYLTSVTYRKVME